MRGSIIIALLLAGCAGNPPKMERPVKLWNGTPERQSLCRTSVDKAVAFAKKHLARDLSKSSAAKYMRSALLQDAVECIGANQKEFAAFVALTAEDLGVLLRYQENLLFSCQKWKQ